MEEEEGTLEIIFFTMITFDRQISLALSSQSGCNSVVEHEKCESDSEHYMSLHAMPCEIKLTV